MKKSILSIFIFKTILLSSFGQSPESFTYQAVARNSGVIIANQTLGFRVKILQGSPSGPSIYTEYFTPTTNAYGLVNLEIGTGASSYDFSAINWGNGSFFIETSIDFSGGFSYAVMGSSQLLSVPYAIYSKFAENISNDLVDDADADPNNEIQAVKFVNDTLYLTNGGQVYLGAYAIDLVDDADSDPNNEIQAVSFVNDTLYLSNGGQVYLGAYTIDLVDDADSDPSNEIQAVSFVNDTLYLSNGGQVYLGAYTIDLVDDADSDPNNEIELPSGGDNGQVLQTDGSGNYVWTGKLDSTAIANMGFVAEKTYSIGLYPEMGGYVFWVSTDGKHGLVSETQDQPQGTWWSTQYIISIPSSHSTDGQRYRDWRLPTLYELDEMYLLRTAIGGFSPLKYHASDENDHPDAGVVDFSNGSHRTPLKYLTHQIRSVREF